MVLIFDHNPITQWEATIREDIAWLHNAHPGKLAALPPAHYDDGRYHT